MHALTSIDLDVLRRVIGGNGAEVTQPPPVCPTDRDMVSEDASVKLGSFLITRTSQQQLSDRNRCLEIMGDRLCGPRRTGGGILLGGETTVQPSAEQCTTSLNTACGLPPGQRPTP